MKKLFLIIGAPGSGKTTDAEIIAKNNNGISHFSTGELLRDEVKSGSTLGTKIDGFISKGNLVPLEIVIDTIITAIKNANDDIILIDGYPRSIEQMISLDKILIDQTDIELTSVIEVEVSEEVARDRVLGRARGADDNETVFTNRMKVYTDPLKDIQSFYTEKKLLKVINGERTIEAIVDEMFSFIQTKI
ncbi:MAG: Adenylate kinase (EC [uncultured Campylobacterales bacterium]|uniref:Adenylate kinase n=1 Tax=uncultured Campylobacterales bacterium TaxID=352960 RepID=A0A6S6SJ79_9BACT|nr:MAG: Adenylate kinase (EC [uncultured Campylobacterales bacterium]